MSAADYRAFQPEKTSRERENIEWTITYAFNARDNVSPRLLLIGDSICHGYHGKVREKLAERANITYWATSKCVTDPDYFRELDFILDGAEYDLISFNNGLHSLTTDRAEWQNTYRAAVEFISAKKPDALLTLTLCTPLSDPKRNAVVDELNAYIRLLAEEKNLPVLDLNTPLAPLASEEHMRDVFHWKAPAIEMQADLICAHAADRLRTVGKIIQQGSETGHDGAVK